MQNTHRERETQREREGGGGGGNWGRERQTDRQRQKETLHERQKEREKGVEGGGGWEMHLTQNIKSNSASTMLWKKKRTQRQTDRQIDRETEIHTSQKTTELENRVAWIKCCRTYIYPLWPNVADRHVWYLYVQDKWRSHPRHTPPPPLQKKTKNYLTPVSASRRRIRPTKYEDFEATNIIDRHEVRNTRGFQLPAYNTKQYQNSFSVRTVVDWNHLEENIIKAGSASAFTSALSRSTPPAS